MEKIGRRKMTRKDYEAVKKMDRHQFDMFCKSLYEQGKQDSKIELGEIREILIGIKGIGEKKVEKIIELLREKIGEKYE